MYVDFDITPYCNINCSFCYAEAEESNNKGIDLLNLKEFDRIFQEFDDIGIMRVGFEGGEPFLRKDWYDIFKLADEHYFNYFINTNATLIDSAVAKKIKEINVDKICVSLDGSNSHIHDLSRGKNGTFGLIIRGIQNLVKENI